MLEYNEVVERTYIIFEGQPYEVISSHVFRKQQRKPVNAVKMRNMITGKVTETSFHVSDKVQEADLSTRDIKYLYANKGEYWFCEATDPSKRFSLAAAIVEPQIKFIKTNSVLPALIFEDKIIGVKMPIKVELKVTEADPAVRGDTVKGGSKEVTLETGAKIHVPMFIEAGQIIRINTENEEYTDKVN